MVDHGQGVAHTAETTSARQDAVVLYLRSFYETKRGQPGCPNFQEDKKEEPMFQAYLLHTAASFIGALIAFGAFVFVWRWIARGDAQRALDSQAEAAQEIQRLKAALYDKGNLERHLKRENADLRRVVEEARNHNRNWNHSASVAIGIRRA